MHIFNNKHSQVYKNVDLGEKSEAMGLLLGTVQDEIVSYKRNNVKKSSLRL